MNDAMLDTDDVGLVLLDGQGRYTPLTSIHGFTGLVLERDDLPEEVVHQLTIVARNVDRLDRLVADLLQTAQAEQGRVHLDREPTDVAELVRHLLEAVRPALEKADLTLESDVPDDLVVTVDPRRFQQVVDNLVSNAVKYTLPGGHVSVRLAVDHDRCELAVTDTGIGISMRDRNHVFSRFFRSRHASEQSIQGIGLGLSITKAIVDSHGGRIDVESQVVGLDVPGAPAARPACRRTCDSAGLDGLTRPGNPASAAVGDEPSASANRFKAHRRPGGSGRPASTAVGDQPPGLTNRLKGHRRPGWQTSATRATTSRTPGRSRRSRGCG